MSHETVNRLQEWAIWFNEHRRYLEKTEDLEKLAKFTLKSIDGCMELIAMVCKDIKELERTSDRGSGLYLPNSIRVKGDIKELD